MVTIQWAARYRLAPNRTSRRSLMATNPVNITSGPDAPKGTPEQEELSGSGCGCGGCGCGGQGRA